MKHGADNGTIISEQKVKFLLHQSIALYFEHSGFSKTLKKFISEAKIEKDNTEGSSVDLEEMCRKFLETCNDAKSTINGQKEQVAGVHSKNEEKKKSKLVSEAADNMEDNQLESLPMVPENKVKDDLSTDAKVENGAETEKQSKRKTKKKDAKVENGAETEKRSKHTMKKKDKSKREGDAKEQIEDTNAIVSEKENFEASNEEATPEVKKDSKKRKRPISKENGEQDTEIKADEETKRRKIENLNGETNVHLMSQMGMSSTLDTFCGQAYGAKQYHMVGIYTQRAMLVIC
ncbi:uncharacterized protein [Cicer arietinum]|uniref:uncharacterized protein isoform X1 n=1 Tax=Cicer arietinum TaxID=3827 RepID=UPI00032AD25D